MTSSELAWKSKNCQKVPGTVKVAGSPPTVLFETNRPGKSAPWPSIFQTLLNEDEKRAVLEYMKTAFDFRLFAGDFTGRGLRLQWDGCALWGLGCL